MPNVNKLMQEIHFQLNWWLSVTISTVYAEKGLTLWKRYFESVYTVLFLLVISRKFLCCCIILVNDTLPTSSFLYKLGFKILPTDFLLMWPLLYCFWLLLCVFILLSACVYFSIMSVVCQVSLDHSEWLTGLWHLRKTTGPPPVAVRRVPQRVKRVSVLQTRPMGVGVTTVCSAPGPCLHAGRTAAFTGPNWWWHHSRRVRENAVRMFQAPRTFLMSNEIEKQKSS